MNQGRYELAFTFLTFSNVLALISLKFVAAFSTPRRASSHSDETASILVVFSFKALSLASSAAWSVCCSRLLSTCKMLSWVSIPYNRWIQFGRCIGQVLETNVFVLYKHHIHRITVSWYRSFKKSFIWGIFHSRNVHCLQLLPFILIMNIKWYVQSCTYCITANIPPQKKSAFEYLCVLNFKK